MLHRNWHWILSGMMKYYREVATMHSIMLKLSCHNTIQIWGLEATCQTQPMLFCPSPNFGWFFATHQQHNMYGGNFTKILMVTSFFFSFIGIQQDSYGFHSKQDRRSWYGTNFRLLWETFIELGRWQMRYCKYYACLSLISALLMLSCLRSIV